MTDGIVENLYVEYDSGYGAAFTYDGGTINHLYISTVDGNGKKIEVTPVAGMVYIGGQTSEDDTAPIAKIGEKSYASLAAAVAAAKNGDTVTLLKDVDLSSAVEIDKNVDLDLGGHKLSRDGYSLDIYGDTTIKNGTIEVTKHGDVCAVWVNKTANLTVENDVTLIATDEAFALGFDPSCTAAEVTFKGTIAKGNGITVGGSIKDTSTNNKLTLDGAKIDATGCGLYLAGCAVTTVDSGSMIVGAETGIEIRAGKLIVNGAAITGNGVPTSVTPNGNGTTAVGAGIAVAQHTTRLPIDVTIADGTISGYTGLLESNPQNNPAEAIAKVNINVTGGRFAAINGGVNAVSSEDKRVIISGGVFSNKFDNAYCVAGRTVVANENVETKDVYPYTVGTIKAEGDNQVKTDTRDGNTKVTLGNKIAEKDKKAATDVGTSVTPTGLTDTAQITADDKAQALTELVKANKVILTEDGKIPEDTTVTVVKETYLDVTVTAYDTTNNTVSMEIVPKYNLIAVAKTGNIENRIPLQSA